MTRQDMDYNEIIDQLTWKIIDFDKGDPKRIQHLLKVHRFAQLIARAEHVDEHTRQVLECAAVLHDVGIHPAEAKYGRCDGKLQEQEGPAPARRMLQSLGLPPADIERTCYLIAHHHTYTDIDGIDYQILIEADYIVNASESGYSQQAIRSFMEHTMKTAAGIRLTKTVFGV